MTRTHTTVDSPIGPLTLVADDGVLCGLHMDTGAPVDGGEPDHRGFDAATEQLGEYFSGQRLTFDLPLAPAGTPWQLRVWGALRRIPYGETRSYGWIAGEVGRPGAARAVGLANGRNPIAVIVPCHRVIGADGSLTGFGGGLPRKRHLLDLEARVAGTTPQALFA